MVYFSRRDFSKVDILKKIQENLDIVYVTKKDEFYFWTFSNSFNSNLR